MSIYGTEFFAGRSETVTQSARVVVGLICDLLDPKSVLDLGCGQGEWVYEFMRRGLDDKAIGVDIAAPEGLLQHDLTEPLDLGRWFDLVLCLETGEHLPEEAAATLVASCGNHSDQVVFSAAVPGQEGKGHINCQPHEYWHALFAEQGFETLDIIRGTLADDGRVSPWYRNNIFLYARPPRLAR